MKLIRIIPVLAAACALAACSTVTVSTDYDHTAPFARYRNYAIAPAANHPILSPTGEIALRESLHTHLAARGFHEAPQSKADIDIVPHAFFQDKTSVQQYTDWGYGYNGTWPYGYGRYSMWAGAPQTYVDINQYTEGTLVLDFVDTRTKKLVFRGTGSAVVSIGESNRANIDEAVKKIVAEFPAGTAH